ncbi:succinate--CoA ligase [GDP-forming] subunit beta, mitochondrial isoform X2 [Bacillus rossius redtenbacheri]|uniref:succinate--CoA ligase [GDP-forming] subunit beta, mitochondrial isoform X2 n=1 Tax=Bacillus rossius redtenbacheri TaxID=93214 RepID=UPI002FDECDA6
MISILHSLSKNVNAVLLNQSCWVVQKVVQRHLNLLEYQSKVLLQNNGVAVQQFKIVETTDEAERLPQQFIEEYVVKAQILAGGRGLGYFDNGFKGGVHITKDPGEVPAIVKKMIGHHLITKQTPKSGCLVHKVMVAESVTIIREVYICILMDREHNGPVIIASAAGGTDIETVAKNSPHLISTVPVDIEEGVTDKLAEEVAQVLQFKGSLIKKAALQIKKLWQLFLNVDAVQLEINPLVETDKGCVIAVDAKISFDDNAWFRQKEIFEMEDKSEIDSREVEASRYNLNYIAMSGNIGCLVNGAGLAMATMDIIKLYGGEPANFLDVGGGVQEEQVLRAFGILISDEKVKAILVNVFGGIVNCATIARGIVNASREMNLTIPLIVRLEGTNVKEAKQILADSELPILSADSLDDAAKKAVASIQ